MRIISGLHKGKRLQAPKKLPIRPTTDMAKEGLFNMLQHRYMLHGLVALDLYSGSGNMAYEFGSRGAQRITAVDQHPGCVQFISKTSLELDLPIEVIRSDVFSFLKKNTQRYELVFADPPYDFEEAELLKLIRVVIGWEETNSESTLDSGGWFILEHRPQLNFEAVPSFVESRKYGSSVFSFFGHDKG